MRHVFLFLLLLISPAFAGTATVTVDSDTHVLKFPSDFATANSLITSSYLGTWTGSTNITTLGTITVGTVPWARVGSTPTTISGYGIADAQPLDSDLTAIAALTTAAYGRSLLATSTALAARVLTGASTARDISTITVPETQYGSGTAVLSYTASEDFDQPNANVALGGTITSLLPSGGTLTFSADIAGTVGYIRDRQFHLLSSAGNTWLRTGTSFSHTANTTAVSYFKVPDGVNGDVQVGFTSSSIGSGAAISDGLIIGATGGADTSSIAAKVAGSNIKLVIGCLKPKEAYGVAIKLTAGGWEAWIQGGYFEQFGAVLMSANWVKLYTSTSTIAGTLRGSIQSSFAGIDVPVSRFTLASSFAPSQSRVRMIEADTSLYVTHEGAAVYDTAGNLWTAWYKGTSDSAADGVVLVACRLANGTWSATSTVYTSSGVNREDVGSLSLVGGAVWLVTNTTSNGFTDCTPKSRVLTVDSSATITVGTVTTFTGVGTSGYNLNYNPIYTDSSGYYIMPLASDTQFWAAYSTNGTSWTVGTKYSAGVEPTFVEEPDGTLAAYLRTGQGVSATAPRYVSANHGSTWTSSGTIAVPSNNSRMQAVKLPGGNVMVVGNDSTTDSVRTKTSIWQIGTGGALVSKALVNSATSGSQNYPAIAVFGDRLTLVMPVRTSITNAPGYVYVSEQPLSAWGRNVIDAQQVRDIGYGPVVDSSTARITSLAVGTTAATSAISIGSNLAINGLADGSLELYTTGTKRAHLTAGGDLYMDTAGSSIVMAAGGLNLWNGRGGFKMTADGLATFINWAGNTTNTVFTANQLKGGVTVVSADQTLLSTSPRHQVLSGSGGNTWILPAVASNSGLEFVVKNRSSGNLTIQRAGSDNIYDTTTQTAITVAAGSKVILVNDGTYWLAE